MQKLRKLYQQTQRKATTDLEQLDTNRLKKIHEYANKQIDTISQSGDFSNLQETMFIRDQIKKVIDIQQQAISQGYKKSKIQTKYNQLFQRNFNQNKQQNTMTKIEQKKTVVPENKSPLVSLFLDQKKKQLQKSKLGFKSVLQNHPDFKLASKYPVRKDQSQYKNPVNNDEVKGLKHEINVLQSQIEQLKVNKDFKYGLAQIQKRQYEQKLKQLNHNLQKLMIENQKLKQQKTLIQQNIHHQPLKLHNIQEQKVYQQLNYQYDPYNIKYNQNDISKINNKIKHSQIKPNQHQNINKDYKIQQILQPQKSINQLDFHNIMNSSFRSQNIKVSHFTAEDEVKNIAVRSKMAFFKPSMVLYRGNEYQIAVKSQQLINWQRRTVNVYVNNKTQYQMSAYLVHQYNNAYYNINIPKKMIKIAPGKQAREQIEVRLKYFNDLDDVILSKLIIEGKQHKFLLPAMFIEFMQPPRDNLIKKQHYQVNVVSPLYQFSSLSLAKQIIPFQNVLDHYSQSGKIYAKSKMHEGFITLRWKKQDVEVETIKSWKLYISYLIFREY